MPKKKIRKSLRGRSAKRPHVARRTPGKAAAILNTSGLQKGEILAGISTDGKSAYRLAVMEIDGIEQTNHAAALAHARKLGGDLPSRIDGLVLHGALKEKFKTDRYYWTNEDYAGVSSYAWTQWFGNGGQDRWFKSDSGRVVVVRRVPL